MAPDTSNFASKPPMTSAELVTLVKGILEADEEHQAKVSSATPSELSTGSTIDLSHKGIAELPAEVVLLVKDKVERLALSHNRRITLPNEIAQCNRLRYLNLRWNNLDQFPEAVLSLAKLEILDISRNNIDVLPEDISRMSNLKYLAFAKNQVRRLPIALGEMNLVKLKFDENPIEFPPPEALNPNWDAATSAIDTEKEKDVCQQVKRFMRATALQERQKTTSEDDLSESSVETPRPPKRSITGGRFPVRPSVSGIDNVPNLNAESPPEHQSQVSLRSHARAPSSNYVPPVKRPGITPLLTSSNDNIKNRSEAATSSTNIRNRRQGYVPRKNSGLNSYSEMSSQLSARSSQAAALTPPHSRATSASSNYLSLGSGGESSSGAVSPVDISSSRALLSRKLASLPESRNSRVPTVNSIKAVKRVLLMLLNIYQPVGDIAEQLRDGTPRRTVLDRQLFNAKTQAQELGRQISRANDIVEDNGEIEPILLMSIMRAAIDAIQTYGAVIQELIRNRQQTIKQIDAFYIRFIINTAHGTLIEARNVCHILGFKTTTDTSRNTIRASQAWSSRTVTPTQPKSATSSNSSRRRGATILPSGGSTASLRGMAPSVPLNSGSRSNTMTSNSAARYADPHGVAAPANAFPSRTNTLRSVVDDFERDDSIENAYTTVKYCCEVATKQLEQSRSELTRRKTMAEQSGVTHVSGILNQAIARCDFARAINKSMASKLPTIRGVDSARTMRELQQMTGKFINEWTKFVSDIKYLGHVQGLDISRLRHNLKPVQEALKDVSRALTQEVPIARPPQSASLHGGLPSNLNMSLVQAAGYIPPVPATPLGAALGPAVQATVPPTPSALPTMPQNTTDYFAPNTTRRILTDTAPNYLRR